MGMNRQLAWSLATLSLLACSSAEEPTASSESDLTRAEYAPTFTDPETFTQPKNYSNDPGWTSSCTGPALSQAALETALGDRTAVAIGRFQVLLRDACSPWENGLSSCGPNRESDGAWTGARRFGLGIVRQVYSSLGSTIVPDTGDIVAYRSGKNVAVKLLGDVVLLGVKPKDNEWSKPQYARLVGDAIVERGVPLVSTTEIGVESTPDAQRILDKPLGAARADLLESVVAMGGRESTNTGRLLLRGSLTESCMRLSDEKNPETAVVYGSIDLSKAAALE